MTTMRPRLSLTLSQTYLIPDDHDEAQYVSHGQFLLERERPNNFSHGDVDASDDIVQAVLRTRRGTVRGEDEGEEI